MADKYGVSPAALCIRYAIQLGTVALPKTADPHHIRQSRRLYQKIIETTGEEKAAFDILEGAEHGDADFETDANMERIAAFLRQYGL